MAEIQNAQYTAKDLKSDQEVDGAPDVVIMQFSMLFRKLWQIWVYQKRNMHSSLVSDAHHVFPIT